jgi:hypothetical protein
MQHICWDGCMFPNAVLETPDTWNNILSRHDQSPRRPRLVKQRTGGHELTEGDVGLHLGPFPGHVALLMRAHEHLAESRQ